MKALLSICCLFCLLSCTTPATEASKDLSVPLVETGLSGPYITILGNVQDGGSPHIGCKKDCCKTLFNQPDKNRMVVSVGLTDPENRKTYLFEATPDLSRQAKMLHKQSGFSEQEMPDGIFLTHAHIGHYSGLMFLGKEALNGDKVPVYAMPRMKQFLEKNGPWSQLVTNNNISLQPLSDSEIIRLSPNLSVTPLTVPHRDEFSETVGFLIQGPQKKALFIPDIDKWEKWNRDILSLIAQVDYALIDGTFFSGEEINNRDISLIPHPFIIESLKRFNDLPAEQKNKIWFIHFNHTNPLLKEDSPESEKVSGQGFHVARFGQLMEL